MATETAESPVEGQAPRQHLIEHHARGVDVGARVDPVAPRLLGGDVVHRSERLLREGLPLVFQARDAEVCDLHAPVAQHHDVLGLDVAVDDAAAVRVGECAHDLGDEVHRLAPVHAAAALHILLEGDPVDQLHDDILRVTRGGDVIDRDDVRMGELGNGARLVAEAAAELRVVRQFVLENLDRHETVQPVTLRLVDVGHAAAADQLRSHMRLSSIYRCIDP